MFQLRSWPIGCVVLNGASLHDHKVAAIASRRHNWMGAQSYKTSHEQRNSEKVSKKEALLTSKSIAFVSTKLCYSKNCLQSFLRGKIEALRSKMYVHGDVFH